MFSHNEFEVYDEMIAAQKYEEALTLLRKGHYKRLVEDRASDAIQACTKYLTEVNYETELPLYSCSEEFLKYVATEGPPEEVLFELLELVETAQSDNLFTSALKALQICLLRQKKSRVNGFEWSLNSIHTYITKLQLPAILESDYDEKQERLLEEDSQVHRILMNHITITMFLEPLTDSVFATNEQKSKLQIFRDISRSRRNVIACFVLQLLGKPLALLDLTNRAEHTNTYSLQCARTLTNALCRLLGDPYFLLAYAERRLRWKRKPPRDDGGVYENSSCDLFLLEENTPILALGIFYYLMLAEDLLPSNTPKVYHPLYIFEMGLYLVNVLLRCDEATLQLKGILLGIKLIQNLTTNRIARESLELPIHATFCKSLSKIIVYSTAERNRKSGLHYLKSYILQFDQPAQFQLLQNLIETTEHSGLMGYLIGMYKNLLAEVLSLPQLPVYFDKSDSRNLILRTICTLPRNVESDLMEISEQIFAALNLVRYLALRDRGNTIGFWDFVDPLRKEYLEPLRTAINLSKAHYRAEEQKVNASSDEEIRIPPELEVSLQTGEQLTMTKQHQLKMLSSAMLAFDLMESLLARVQECIESERTNK